MGCIPGGVREGRRGMLIFLTALIVLILDQVSKYAIYYGFVVNTLGYAGSVTDLQALKAFLPMVFTLLPMVTVFSLAASLRALSSMAVTL